MKGARDKRLRKVCVGLARHRASGRSRGCVSQRQASVAEGTVRNNLRSNNAESVQELRNDLRKNSAKTAEQFRTPGLAAKRYGVILVDPEWRFEPWSREIGMDRAADNHYPTRPKLIASLVKSRSSRLSGNGESGGIFRASAQHCASTASQVRGTPPRNEHGASLARSG